MNNIEEYCLKEVLNIKLHSIDIFHKIKKKKKEEK